MNKSPALTLMMAAFLAVGCNPLDPDNHCGSVGGCADLTSNDAFDAADGGVDGCIEDVISCRDIKADADSEVSADIVIVPPLQDCWACDNSDDCKAGYECLPVGAGKYCIRRCIDDGDCASGFFCNGSDTGNVCLPVSFSCPACIYDTPCDEGMCCNFNTGSCKKCKGECFPCVYDYECPTGQRCYKEMGWGSGFCWPECTDGNCPYPDQTTCTDNGKGVMVCVPDEYFCPACTSPTPFRLDDGSCVECVTSDDCDGGCCEVESHACLEVDCAIGAKTCGSCSCVQCCTDDDCLEFPGGQVECRPDGTCGGPHTCGGLCTPDFPSCAIVQGTEQCVQCIVDADCALVGQGCTCTGDPIYSCVDENGAVCQKETACTAGCTQDSDCPPSGGKALSCNLSGEKGICYDPAGTCDGINACCGADQKCYDTYGLVSGMVAVDRIMGPDTPATRTYVCGCGEDSPCLSGKPCSDMTAICTDETLPDVFGTLIEILCPGGQLSPSMPPYLCMTASEFLFSLLTAAVAPYWNEDHGL